MPKIKKRLNEIFPLVDANGDGQVDRSEMLKRLQIEHNKQEARAKMTLPEHSKAEFAEALEKLDKNTDRMLQFVEIQDDKDVLPTIVTEGTMEDKKAAFAFADENGDGKLDLSDFQRLLAPGIKCKKEHMEHVVQQQMKKVDGDNDGSISWEEYVDSVAGTAFKHGIRDDALEKYMEKEHTLFAKHDQDGNGKLDKTECRAWLFPEETGEMLKYEADHLIEVGDRDKDGKVSYQEMFDAGAYYIGGKLQTQEHDEL